MWEGFLRRALSSTDSTCYVSSCIWETDERWWKLRGKPSERLGGGGEGGTRPYVQSRLTRAPHLLWSTASQQPQGAGVARSARLGPGRQRLYLWWTKSSGRTPPCRWAPWTPHSGHCPARSLGSPSRRRAGAGGGREEKAETPREGRLRRQRPKDGASVSWDSLQRRRPRYAFSSGSGRRGSGDAAVGMRRRQRRQQRRLPAQRRRRYRTGSQEAEGELLSWAPSAAPVCRLLLSPLQSPRLASRGRAPGRRGLRAPPPARARGFLRRDAAVGGGGWAGAGAPLRPGPASGAWPLPRSPPSPGRLPGLLSHLPPRHWARRRSTRRPTGDLASAPDTS